MDLLRELGAGNLHAGHVCEDNLRNCMQSDCASCRRPVRIAVADQSFDLVIACGSSRMSRMARLVPNCVAFRTAVVIDYPAKGALNALTPLLFGLKKSLEGNTRTYTSFSRQELRDQFEPHGFTRFRQVKQFLMPMVVHRVGKGSLPLRLAESVFRVLGLTALFGSPVILRSIVD